MGSVFKLAAAFILSISLTVAGAAAQSSEIIAIAGNVESGQLDVGVRPFIVTSSNLRSVAPTWSIKTGNLMSVDVGSVYKLGLAANSKDNPLLATTKGVWRTTDITSDQPVWNKVFDPATFTSTDTSIPRQFLASAVTSIVAADNDPATPGHMVLLIRRITPTYFVDLFVARTQNYGQSWDYSPRIKLINPTVDSQLREISISDGYDIDVKKGNPQIVMVSVSAYSTYNFKGGYVLTSVNGGASFPTTLPQQKLPFTDEFGQTTLIDSCADCPGIFAWGNPRYDNSTMSFTVSYDLGDTWETRPLGLNLDRSKLGPTSSIAKAPVSLLIKHPTTGNLFFAPDNVATVAGTRVVESNDDFNTGTEHVLPSEPSENDNPYFAVGVFSPGLSAGAAMYFGLKAGLTTHSRAVFSTQNFQSWSSKPVAPYYAAACYAVGASCIGIFPRSMSALIISR